MMKGECGRMPMPGMDSMDRGMGAPSMDAQSAMMMHAMRGLTSIEEEDDDDKARMAILEQMKAQAEPSKDALLLVRMGRNGNAY